MEDTGVETKEIPKDLLPIQSAFKMAEMVPRDHKMGNAPPNADAIYLERLKKLVSSINKAYNDAHEWFLVLAENKERLRKVPRFVEVHFDKNIQPRPVSADTPVFFDTRTLALFQLKNFSDTSQKTLDKLRKQPGATISLDDKVLEFPDIPSAIIRASYPEETANKILETGPKLPKE